jgi:hypothetical protein
VKRISFGLTEPQFVAGTKTVTRRLGWYNLKAGDELLAVNKCMGLRKGERSRELGRIRVVSVRREPLGYIDDQDVHLEGFPEMNADCFIDFFCKAQKCSPSTEVTRIEFVKL